jgi:two-component system sensor histidine kinase KdpD
MVTESREALSTLARAVSRRFDLEFVALAVPRDGDWDVYQAGTRSIALDERQLASAYATAQTTLEFDAYARTYAGHQTTTVDGDVVRLVPLRLGTKPIGVLAAAGRPVEAGTLDTLAGVVAIAIERAHFLEERKAGELTRQSEQLKTALLASLSHDLRTPLTAIRIAASNIKETELQRVDRIEQSDVILAEVERLTRLFQNLLEMARIDAGGITTEPRWTHPSEIVAAAREQVEQTLQHHTLEVTIEPDIPVRVDPRLTATALAHLLENAAHYSADGSPVDVIARAGHDELTIQVRDRGAGIAAADLPHLFERFYRGAAAKSRTSGTGMGLWIVRGLLAAENGRVWAENCADGGAQFTMTVPAAVQDLASTTAST